MSCGSGVSGGSGEYVGGSVAVVAGGSVGAAYSLITDGSTTKGSRRKEMEALHLQFPGLDPALEGSGMQIDIHSSLRHVRMRTEFFGIVPIDVAFSTAPDTLRECLVPRTI